jgi:hypothetical protein
MESSSWSSPDENHSFTNADWRSFRAKLVAADRASRSLEPPSYVDPDSAVDHPPPPITVGDKWAHTIHEPEKGCLLIATEKLDGVHIFRTNGCAGPVNGATGSIRDHSESAVAYVDQGNEIDGDGCCRHFL